ncbi:MAG: Methyltransferase type 12, partial [Chloroflexi bacterium]|nr:Methyltransferase type 12 [Chloroflexota bacterium]
MSQYSLSAYGQMIADRQRTDAYLAALRQSIRPGCTVLEIGAGIGFFAFMALRLGAGTVYAIEQDRSIEVARQIARANNVEGIHFIEDVSTRVDLPCRADVVFSDLRGVLPLCQQHIPSIADARRRLLASGGTLVPQCDTIWASPVEATELYARTADPWGESLCELDMSAARSLLLNGWRKARVDPAQLLAEPSQWAQIDYTTVEEPDVRGLLQWTVARAGAAHGICAWFDTILVPGIGFSNAPSQPEAIYGSAFFPFSEPLAVDAGDVISVDLRADLVGDDYVW